MAKNQKVDQKTAEIFQGVPLLEPDPETKQDYAPVGDQVIRVLEDYPGALIRAQMNDEEYIIVSAELYAHPRIGGKTNKNSFTTGNPGIRVWKEGCKEEDERIEKMKAEEFHEHYAKQLRGV